MSEEKVSELPVPSTAGSPISDIVIDDEEPVGSGSSSAFRTSDRSSKSGQIVLDEKNNEKQHDNVAGSDIINSARVQTGSGEPAISAQTSSGTTSSELNPFAKPFSRKIDESGDLLGDIPAHHNEEQQGDGSKSEHHQEQDIESVVEEHLRFPTLPRVNCPEKIIVCLDLSSEVNRVPFVSRDYTKYQPLDLIKRALNIFVRTKSTMNPAHEFALVILQDTAIWMQDFTSDVDDFINVLGDTTNDTQDVDGFDLTTLFDTILDKVDLPFVEDMLVLPPPHIVRTLFIYGRSNCIPRFQGIRESQKQLSSSPYFFFDVFYVHEPPSEENLCKEVYDVFLDLDANNTSYIHEVGRNTTHLHNKMAMLLSHPLQRPVQMQASHALNPET